MKPFANRREFLRILALGSGSALLAACAQSAAPSPTTPPAKPTVAPPTTAAAAKPTTAAAPPVGQPAAAKPGTQAVLGPAQKTPLIDQLYEAAKKEGKVVYWDIFEQEEAQNFEQAFEKAYPRVVAEILLITADEQRV